ncbi:MAG: hypothetical protein EAZ92_17015, partial [Candidatus Kapaibacterium sp.]
MLIIFVVLMCILSKASAKKCSTRKMYHVFLMLSKSALYLQWLIFGSIGSIFFGCTNNEEDIIKQVRLRTDSIRAVLRQQAITKDSVYARIYRHALDSVPNITFTQRVISSRTMQDSIKRVFAKDSSMIAYRALTTINRKNTRYFRVGDTIVFPSMISSDLRLYSLFPHRFPWIDSFPKVIFVSNKYQCYACYEKGRLVRFAACNTGREKKPTFPGRYTLNWRDKLRRSSLDTSWILPHTWNFHLFAGSAFHEFDMPGRPVSHSCVRQFAE